MSLKSFGLYAFLLLTCVGFGQTKTPPFHGTIFLDPDIITPDDPTAFQALADAGQGSRTMFDRRVNNWTTVNALLFIATYDDGLSAEVQVNPEFGSRDVAELEAYKYAKVIGQLPNSLRKGIETISIHKGMELFGGGNKNVLIHTGQADQYVKDGILEEALVHEATHTSLDAKYALDINWLRAQQNDGTFLSKYAQENPKREDVSETFLLYMAVKHRADRITDELRQTILNTIPNRIYFLESQDWDFYPLTPLDEEMVTPMDPVVEINLDIKDVQPMQPTLEWIAFEDFAPENSVSGGSENGTDLVVCRGSYNGATHPGKLIAGKCNIGWGGNEIELPSFEVLVNTGVQLTWSTYAGILPKGAVEAGNENDRVLYVGQFTRPDGSTHPGKVFGVNGKYQFNYGYGGKEIVVTAGFRILTR